MISEQNGTLNGDDTTSKFFVDELAGDSFPLTVTFNPDAADITAVEIFTNLNRRDLAGVDADVLSNGVRVSLKKVPTSAGGWTSDPMPGDGGELVLTDPAVPLERKFYRVTVSISD